MPNGSTSSAILRQHLYYDKKSTDPHTKKKKRKYKLAGNCLLDFYFFHVLTTRESACKKSCTLSLDKSDWENVVPTFRNKLTVCYCDLRKYENLPRVDLLKKIKDKNNGFPYVGKLCDSKYGELLKLNKKLCDSYSMSKEVREIIDAGISPTVSSIQSKLNLG